MMHRKKIALTLCCVCAMLFTAQTFADTLVVDNTGTAPDSYVTIQLAIDDSTTGDTILLTAGQTFTGSGNINLTFSTDLIIGRTGDGADPIIDMETMQRFCSIDTGYTVTISNVIIQNGSDDEGGAIQNLGILYCLNCTFSNNDADEGGAIDNLGGETQGSGILNATNCTFSNNSAPYGGAIASSGIAQGSGILHATDCTFSNNSAENGVGGAIANTGNHEGSGILHATDCTFSNNSADLYGGAIWNRGEFTGSGISHATGCTFSNNSAGLIGGAIGNNGRDEGSGILNANGCIFDHNNSVDGGVLYNGLLVQETSVPGTSIFECCRFVDNSATTSADALYNLAGTVTAQNCWWATNTPDETALFYGAVDYEPWIQMSFNVGPLALGQPTLGQADLTVTFSPSCIPDGTPVAFSITSGTIVPEEGTTLNGTVTAHAYGFEGTQTVCAIAEPNSETPFKLCKTIQEDSQPLAPANVIGRQQMHRFPRCADLVNVITWQKAEGDAPAAAYYEIFAAPNLDTPIANISANAPLRFAQHQRKPHVIYTYYLYAVTAEGVRSEPVKVIVP